MSKADPSILQCKVRQLAWNVLRKCVCRKIVGLMGGHMIFELRGVMRIVDCLIVRAPNIDTTRYLYIVFPETNGFNGIECHE
jgi:hypothetical protein